MMPDPAALKQAADARETASQALAAVRADWPAVRALSADVRALLGRLAPTAEEVTQ
ncbi:hypothetical protein [Streptomyces sp. NPDC048188]|uniref:hypothetical protein n=1 Tax=Streptomyces sp. NPDC048188 TaxID=3155749 RepID=UPI003444F7C7